MVGSYKNECDARPRPGLHPEERGNCFRRLVSAKRVDGSGALMFGKVARRQDVGGAAGPAKLPNGLAMVLK